MACNTDLKNFMNIRLETRNSRVQSTTAWTVDSYILCTLHKNLRIEGTPTCCFAYSCPISPAKFLSQTVSIEQQHPNAGGNWFFFSQITGENGYGRNQKWWHTCIRIKKYVRQLISYHCNQLPSDFVLISKGKKIIWFTVCNSIGTVY